MHSAGSASKIRLNSFDDLFGVSDAEQIIQVELTELYPFKNHPFRVLDDKKMDETAENIQKYGVLVPILIRQRAEGGYEIIAGHRRKRGAERAGLHCLPAIIRNYTDDEATIIMVDSNIQREDILPSEKAKAYSMKYEAMKHQGRKGGGSTLDEVGETAGESGKTVQRYIWLARLTEPLLEVIDTKRLGISQGADISFLPTEQQLWVQKILQETKITISNAQAVKLKEYSKEGILSPETVQMILAEEKPKKRKYVIREEQTVEGSDTMGEPMQFAYYYGIEAEQFAFYRVPRLLIKDKRFRNLSSDAKLLYGLMLDRMSLSMKNGWLDEENRAYIIYTVENMMEDLGCSKPTCVKIMRELDSEKGIGLIEKKRGV